MTQTTNTQAAAINAMASIVAQNDVAQKIVAADKAEAAAPKATKKAGAKKAAEKQAAPTVAKEKTTRPAPVAKVETTKPAATVAAAAAIALPVKFMLNPSIRPGAGQLLYSHTEAVLQVLGMYDGKAYAYEVLAALIGDTAIKYHTKMNRFMEGKKGLTLSSDGKAHFQKRGMAGNKEKFSAQDVDAYKTILTTGAIDNRIVKNAQMVKAFAPNAVK